MDVNDCCRFCRVQLRNDAGKLQNSTQIFEKRRTPGEKNIFQRLQALGLTLTERRNRSSRSCIQCDTVIETLERVLPSFRRWEDDEKVAGVTYLMASQIIWRLDYNSRC